MLGKLILLLIAIAVIYFFLKSVRNKAQGQQDAPKPQTQDMVSCQYCGVHLPKSDAVQANGKYYCSTAHSQGRSE